MTPFFISIFKYNLSSNKDNPFKLKIYSSKDYMIGKHQAIFNKSKATLLKTYEVTSTEQNTQENTRIGKHNGSNKN